MDAKELIQKMPEAFNADAAEDTEAVIQYEISKPMYHVIKDGKMEVHEGRAENPSITLKISDEHLVKIVKGEMNGLGAFMSGQIQLEGDMTLAQRLVGFVDQDKLSS